MVEPDQPTQPSAPSEPAGRTEPLGLPLPQPGMLPPRRPRRLAVKLAVAAALGLSALLLVLTIGVQHDPASPEPPSFAVPQLKPVKGKQVPRAALPAPADRPAVSDQAALEQWAQRISAITEVSPRVLAAYGRAEMRIRAQQPGCELSWTMLAGIGRVESRHGNFGGAQVGADGRVSKPIIGPPLDGSEGVKRIADTDGGRLDRDTTWDRAVGPMQFLPTTWQKWSQRASGDGAPTDPQNIDDAAFTAARYLCSGGEKLTTPKGWWNAVLMYNQSVSYGQDVFSGADAYAAASKQP